MFPLAVNKDRFFHDMHPRQAACHRYSIEDSMQCVQSCVLSCKPPDRGCRRHGWSRWDGSRACLFHILEVIFVLLIFLRQPLWRDGHESGCRIFSGSRLPCTEENVPEAERCAAYPVFRHPCDRERMGSGCSLVQASLHVRHLLMRHHLTE